jgi:CDGSH-type Zn-finger protein
MATEHEQDPVKKILIKNNGPYMVQGNIPLVCKTQIVSEFGEPLTWLKTETIETEETYYLCRCGQSKNKPFCDKTHRTLPFDGTEMADTRRTAERQILYPGGEKIRVKRDFSLCTDAGFCANRLTDIEKLALDSDNPQVQAQIISMIEHCPSGSLIYSIRGNGADIEPDLPQQIAVTIEITSEGPIEGPLWVTGNIPIERADCQPFETRNRVTLCCCGRSKNKPLCDGAHRHSSEE